MTDSLTFACPYPDDDQGMNSVQISSSLCGGQSYPLGMESGQISDKQLTSSSSYSQQSVGPQNAR